MDSAANFLRTFVPQVRRSLRSLDLIAFLAISPAGPGLRSGEDARFRRRVDEALKRALLDDDNGLFEDQGSPRVVELPAQPDRQLAELIRLTRTG